MKINLIIEETIIYAQNHVRIVPIKSHNEIFQGNCVIKISVYKKKEKREKKRKKKKKETRIVCKNLTPSSTIAIIKSALYR